MIPDVLRRAKFITEKGIGGTKRRIHCPILRTGIPLSEVEHRQPKGARIPSPTGGKGVTLDGGDR